MSSAVVMSNGETCKHGSLARADEGRVTDLSTLLTAQLSIIFGAATLICGTLILASMFLTAGVAFSVFVVFGVAFTVVSAIAVDYVTAKYFKDDPTRLSMGIEWRTP